jgi:hypothetical protein
MESIETSNKWTFCSLSYNKQFLRHKCDNAGNEVCVSFGVYLEEPFFGFKQETSLILDFYRGLIIDFWFWDFCTVCKVNFPTFRKPLWVPSSLVRSQNVCIPCKNPKTKNQETFFWNHCSDVLCWCTDLSKQKSTIWLLVQILSNIQNSTRGYVLSAVNICEGGKKSVFLDSLFCGTLVQTAVENNFLFAKRFQRNHL